MAGVAQIMPFLLLHPVGCVVRRFEGHSHWLGAISFVLLMAHSHGSVPVYNTHVHLPATKASSLTRFNLCRRRHHFAPNRPDNHFILHGKTAVNDRLKYERRCAMSICSAVVCTSYCDTVSAVCRITTKCGC
jgi:hypothetical protein